MHRSKEAEIFSGKTRALPTMLGISSRLAAATSGHDLRHHDKGRSLTSQSSTDLARSNDREVILKVLGGGPVAFPNRALKLPAILGRTAGSLGTYPGQNNGIFESPLISRRHAELRADDGRIVLTDLGSSNGTYLNGKPLSPNVPAQIFDGDVIQLGADDEDLDVKDHAKRNIREEVLTLQIRFVQPCHSLSNPSLVNLKAAEVRKVTFSPGRVLEEAKKMLGKSVDTIVASSSSQRLFDQGQFWLSSEKSQALSELHKARSLRDELKLKLELSTSRLSRIETILDGQEYGPLLQQVDDLISTLAFSLDRLAEIRFNRLDDYETIHQRNRLADALKIIVPPPSYTVLHSCTPVGTIRDDVLHNRIPILLLVFFAIKQPVDPWPRLMIPTEWTADGLLILNLQDAQILWSNGFFGTNPFANSGAKTPLQAPIYRLSWFEGLHLLEAKSIKVIRNGESLSLDSFRNHINRGFSNFDALYLVYCDLRKADWTVKSGLNYGTDFVLYRSNPDKEHSKYAVIVIEEEDKSLTWSRLLGINRSCLGAKKTLLVAVIRVDGTIDYHEVSRFLPESERD